jgi:predicted  nucleic acid-binding Zn-ribbon protein
MQSNEEVIRLFDEYGRGFAPSDLIQNEQNAKAMLDYVLGKYGLVSISYVIEAEQTLGTKLQRVKQPTPAELRDAAAKKEQERMLRDFRDSIKPQPSWEERMKLEKAEQEAKAEEKRQQAAQSQINTLIDSYSINLGPGRLDFSRAEYFQDQLRKIKVKKNGKYDAVLTLRKVQEALSKLP